MESNMVKFGKGYSLDDLCRIAVRCKDPDVLYDLTQQHGSNPVVALKIVSNKYADGRSLRWLMSSHIEKANKLPKDTKDDLNVLAHTVKVLIRIAERCNDICSENANPEEKQESNMLLKKEEVKLYLCKKTIVRCIMVRDKKPSLVVWYCLHRMKDMNLFMDFVSFASAEVIRTYIDSITENPNITADAMRKVKEKLAT